MPFPMRTCVVCGEEFELRPNKPGFANRCYVCSEEEAQPTEATPASGFDRKGESEVNAERRRVIREMLYRKDS